MASTKKLHITSQLMIKDQGFFPQIMNKAKYLLSLFFLNIVLELLANVTRREKEIKAYK